MRVDFTIITMFHTEHDMNTTTFKCIFIKANIPGCDLKDMQ